jgi:putative transposase
MEERPVDAQYQVDRTVDPKADDEIGTALARLAREGARLMLEQALAAEVDEFLGRQRYARSAKFGGYRNGYQRPRKVALGTWSIDVRAPRVSDVPAGSPAFESRIVPKQRRLTEETQQLFAQLYLEGLSSGDFEPVFRQLLGETAPLSANTVLRLKERWAAEYEEWRRRPLDHAQFVYVWADGIYLGAGLEKQNSCLLTLLGARADGSKELLAMEIGYRESKDSWAEVLRSLRERGLDEPLLFIADGHLGIWAALTDVFPTARRQRCWNHRLMNVQDKLPRRLQRVVRSRLYQLYTAPTQSKCEAGRDELVQWLHDHAQVAAAETLLRDWEDFVTFYDFPTSHWFHIRTTNPIESVFAGVRLRTNVAKRARNRQNALYLVFKIVQRLSRHWRALNGEPTLMQALVAGVVFKDGVIQPRPDQDSSKEVAAA